MPKINKILKYAFPLALILVSLILCIRNYSPGTYLIGWDSLHPEFNFPEAFRRVWEGVWRGEQGVGAIAAHSHISDWPRIVFLFLESLFLPNSFLRYSYIFLCLILGPIGMYFLLDYIFRRQKSGLEVSLAAFFGGLFYLLNLGTLQQFFVPFEMFPTQFAFLPFLFLYAFKIFREGKKRNYLIFAVLTIISSPQAYAATLFYAYFGALIVLCFTYFLLNRSASNLKRAFYIIGLTIILNLYWILPNIYSVIYQSQTVINANINLLFTPEAYLRNLGYEGLNNVLIQKNFLFDWRSFDYSKMQFTDLMQVWNQKLSSYGVLEILYLLSGISVVGAFISFIKKDKIGATVFIVALYSLIFLAGGRYIDFQNLRFPGASVLQEALRDPFTKFSIIFSFCLSFFFAYFFFSLISIFKKNSAKLLAGLLLLVSVPSAIVFTTTPMFQGNLISPIVRRDLPVEYKELFDWFNTNPSGRIAVLPMPNLWGWDYHSWNYEGSGFLTYGTSDPLLVRDFDRWSSNNEDFYSQASFALYANKPQVFMETLKKYQVKYLLLDESLINAGGINDILYTPQIKQILSNSSIASKVAEFGFLSVYEINPTVSEISAPPKFNKVASEFTYSSIDPAYPEGDYVQNSTGSELPFSNMDPKGDVEIKVLKSGLSSELSFTNTSTNKSVNLSVKNPVVENLSQNRGQPTAFNCDLYKVGSVGKEVNSNGILYTADGGGVSCDYLSYPNLSYSQGYVVRIVGKNETGRSLKIYFFNNYTKQPDLQELLPTGDFDESYFVYPKDINGAGYSLNLETRSFVGVPSTNLLTKVEIYPVDYQFLANSFNTSRLGNSDENNILVKNSIKYGNWLYKIDVQNSGLIELGQGYDFGWVAIPAKDFPFNIFHFPLYKHVKVNSWANGWIIPPTIQPSSHQTIYIIFWPQILEWGGALAGIITLLILVFSRQKRSL